MENTGERQVATTLDGIRKDHTARYEWAASRLGQDCLVLDLACGVGYGSFLLAENACVVIAMDVDPEAIAFAKRHYRHPRAIFRVADISKKIDFHEAEVAVAFECIEHLEDPRPMLKNLRAANVGTLLASVPNEEVFPFKNYAYHHRHYTRLEFEALLNECGWQVTEWHGQLGPESPVEPDVNGRTLVVVAVPMAEPKQNPGSTTATAAALKPAPKSVAIIGLGPSKSQYVDIVSGLGGRQKLYDEVWVINALGNVLDCDRIFHMDDVRVQEIRAAARPDSNIAAMLSWMKNTSKPIMTSRAHPDYPSLVELPLEDMINDLTYDYANNTAAWAMMYAIHIGVEKIGLYGCDFTYPNSHDAEKGRGCLEFWVGYGAARGIKIALARGTTLMDACYPRSDRLYGYDTRKVIFTRRDDGKLSVEFEEISELPTADDIEHRYDHRRHPNVLVEESEQGDEK